MTDTPEVTTYTDSPHAVSAHESGMTFESAMEAVKLGHAVARKCWHEGIFVCKILYRDQPYLVGPVHPDLRFFRPYICEDWECEAEDWKVVEHPVLWDQTEKDVRL